MQNELNTYLVGGAVRDRLLGIDVKDRDYVVVGATPEQMQALGFRQVGADFPVFLHPSTHEEYALARTERKTGAGYHGFSVDFSQSVTLEEDLRRRDLTINAMAEDPAGNIIDPCKGLIDLNDRKLRHVSAAFCEDPVRILRAARFAARFNCFGFQIAAETLKLMTSMVDSGEASHLVTERVWQEWTLALTGSDPQIFIQLLRQCGAYKFIAPELDQLYAANRTDHGTASAGEAGELALIAAAELSEAGNIRFAALLSASTLFLEPEAGTVLVKHLCQRLTVPKSWHQLALLATAQQAICHQALSLTADQLLLLLENTDAFRRSQRFEDFLTVCQANFRSGKNLSEDQQQYPQATRLQQARSVAAEIKVESLETQTLSGLEIKSVLRDKRLQALEAMLS